MLTFGHLSSEYKLATRWGIGCVVLAVAGTVLSLFFWQGVWLLAAAALSGTVVTATYVYGRSRVKAEAAAVPPSVNRMV